MIRDPTEQSRSSISSQPSESTDMKGKGILIEEPKKKSKKLSSSTQVPESVQSTPAEQEEKISDEVVEFTPQINPESSTLQSTANPEGSNPEGSNPDDDSTKNPDEILLQILMDQILMETLQQILMDMKMQILILKTKELLIHMVLKKMRYKTSRTSQQLKKKILKE